MYLATALLRELEASDLPLNDRAALRCEIAKQYEAGGDYEAAQGVLAEVWQGIGARPNVEGLSVETGAEVLLRVGALTGWIGSASQTEGAQEAAKNWISESLRTFERLGQTSKVAEARSDLALCYWRAGAYDEARIMLDHALSEFDDSNVTERARALLRKAVVERASTRLNEALRIYRDSASLFDQIADHLLRGTFHSGLANVLNQLSSRENRVDYVDSALIEYAAASIHFEHAGHDRYQACVETNLGFLYSSIGKFAEAHEHLDRAQVLFTKLSDTLHLAQSDETRARVLLAEGKLVEAEKIARGAMRTLGASDHASLLAEALITHGVTLACLDHPLESKVSFEQAMNVAERAGDFESAGIAALTLIEQLGPTLSGEEVLEAVDRAGTLLDRSEDLSTVKRLARAAFDALFMPQSVTPEAWERFSLPDAIHRYRSRWIRLALEASDGSITKASKLLGIQHHQSLGYLIKHEHPELLEARRPIRTRRRSYLFSPPKGSKKPPASEGKH